MRTAAGPTCLFVLFLILSVLPVPLCAASQYRIDVISTLGGNYGRARAINVAGGVVGESYTAEDVEHAFLWVGSDVSDLGTLGGLRSRAMDINSFGLTVGWASDPDGISRPVRWDGGQATELMTLGGPSGSAWAVNDFGDVVGNAYVSQSLYRAALWRGASIFDLGTLGGYYSVAYDINNYETIVGAAHDAAGRQRAVLWEETGPVDLSSLSGGIWDTARGINDSGQVILWGKPLGATRNHAALWDGGWDDPVLDLGTFGGQESWAYGLNNRGDVVGWAEFSLGNYHAFVFTGQEMVDLGTLGGLFSSAYGINDDGVIVGTAQAADGTWQSVTWTPVTEPSSVISLIAALSATVCLARRRRHAGW